MEVGERKRQEGGDPCPLGRLGGQDKGVQNQVSGEHNSGQIPSFLGRRERRGRQKGKQIDC